MKDALSPTIVIVNLSNININEHSSPEEIANGIKNAEMNSHRRDCIE